MDDTRIFFLKNSVYHDENKLIFNEMMVRSAYLDFYIASSLKQQPAGRHVTVLQDSG
jgi:hypothetical protein